MANRDKNSIPTVTSTLAPDLRRFVDRVREVVGTGSKAVTADEIQDVLPFSWDEDGGIEINDYRLKSCPTVPPAPPDQFQPVGTAGSCVF